MYTLLQRRKLHFLVVVHFKDFLGRAQDGREGKCRLDSCCGGGLGVVVVLA